MFYKKVIIYSVFTATFFSGCATIFSSEDSSNQLPQNTQSYQQQQYPSTNQQPQQVIQPRQQTYYQQQQQYQNHTFNQEPLKPLEFAKQSYNNQNMIAPNITTKKVEVSRINSLQNADLKELVSKLSQRIDALEKSLVEEKMLRDSITQELYAKNQEFLQDIRELKNSNETISYRINDIIVSVNKLIENSGVNSSFENSINEAKLREYELLINELSQQNRTIYDKLYTLEKRLGILER
jgi:E3 ubiquitin-protein ligase DOA10